MLKVSEAKRAELNRIKFGLAIEIDQWLIKTRGKKYEIDTFSVIESPDNHRYVKLEINGEIIRYNYLSKSEFVSRNWYWLQHKSCQWNYKNAVKFKY